jgi:YebC/PmpR family DNA-binding regulatory protein
MSGHSKWATTKRAKETKDARRSGLFTKLAKNIMVAARAGVDSEMNFKLRIAIDKARAYSMPKDNIARAIKSGSGLGEGAQIESLVYEAYGPGGTALIIEALTDNKNRAVANLKHILAKHNGNLASSGSVLWMFERKGEIIINKDRPSEEEELQIIEAGAEDLAVDNEGEVKVITNLENLEKVKNNLQNKGFVIQSSELIYVPKEKLKVAKAEPLLNLLDALDDDDDVNNIYTNVDI